MDNLLRFPNLVVDISKANYLFGIESRVHGVMKAKLPFHNNKEIRREFTKEIQCCSTCEEQVAVAKRWVVIVGENGFWGGKMVAQNRKGKMGVFAILEEVACAIGGTLRESKRGVPHVVGTRAGIAFSVAYFLSTDSFVLFWPWPSGGDEQEKRSFSSIDCLVGYVNGMEVLNG